MNNDGDRNAGEPGTSGVAITLYASNGTTVISTTKTDTNGNYTFTGLLSNTYIVGMTPPAGYSSSTGAGNAFEPRAGTFTGPTNNTDHGSAAGTTAGSEIRSAPIVLRPGDAMTNGNGNAIPPSNDTTANPTVDFGLYQTASLGDRVWYDQNLNGIQDSNEVTSVAGVQVVLFDAVTNQPVATTTTDANGNYNFTSLTPGNYFVQFALPAGYGRSPNDVSGVGKDGADSMPARPLAAPCQ